MSEILGQPGILAIPRSLSAQDPTQPKIPVSTGCPHAFLVHACLMFGSCLFGIWLMLLYLAHVKSASTKFFKHILHTYLDFSHVYLANSHFSQSKKTHEPRTCCIFIQQFLSISLLSIRPDNMATLGPFRTYFCYCRIVGLIPVIPQPQHNKWQHFYSKKEDSQVM